MKILTGKWSFYVNGTMIAIFIVMSLYLFDDNLGLSDGMLAISDFCIESIDAGDLKAPPTLDWQLGLLGGVLIGALASAIISGSWKIEFAPKDTGSIIAGIWKPIVQGIGGGFLVMLGLQIAGDSFWGQWVAAVQLSTGAWIFIISTFIVGALTAVLLDRRRENRGGG